MGSTEVQTWPIDLGWIRPYADKVKALAGNAARVHRGQLLGRGVDVELYAPAARPSGTTRI